MGVGSGREGTPKHVGEGVTYGVFLGINHIFSHVHTIWYTVSEHAHPRLCHYDAMSWDDITWNIDDIISWRSDDIIGLAYKRHYTVPVGVLFSICSSGSTHSTVHFGYSCMLGLICWRTCIPRAYFLQTYLTGLLLFLWVSVMCQHLYTLQKHPMSTIPPSWDPLPQDRPTYGWCPWALFLL